MRGTSRRLSLSDLPADVLARNGLTAEAKRTKPSKYRNERDVVDGIAFASHREAAHYAELKVRVMLGEIRDLRCQPSFDLHAPGGKRIARYVADFSYVVVATGQTVVEDVKGFRTRHYRQKKKHVEAEYGIEVIEL
jgi:hypothetical protein